MAGFTGRCPGSGTSPRRFRPPRRDGAVRGGRSAAEPPPSTCAPIRGRGGAARTGWCALRGGRSAVHGVRGCPTRRARPSRRIDTPRPDPARGDRAAIPSPHEGDQPEGQRGEAPAEPFGVHRLGAGPGLHRGDQQIRPRPHRSPKAVRKRVDPVSSPGVPPAQIREEGPAADGVGSDPRGPRLPVAAKVAVGGQSDVDSFGMGERFPEQAAMAGMETVESSPQHGPEGLSPVSRGARARPSSGRSSAP